MKLTLHCLSLVLTMLLFQSANSQSLKFAKGLSGSGISDVKSVVTDPTGSIYVTGHFTGSFDPGNGINLNSEGAEDIFIAKYNADGVYQWAFRFGSTGSDKGLSIAFNNTSSGVYITGSFTGNVLFGSTQLLSGGGTDIFLAKFDLANGAPQWAISVSGSTFPDSGNSIKISQTGTIFLVGTLNNKAFLAEYNESAQTRMMTFDTTSGASAGVGICLDGGITLVGTFSGTVDFLPGTGTSNLTSAGGKDIFIATYAPSPSSFYIFGSPQKIGSTGEDQVYDVTSDGQGLYLTGTFSGSVSFGSSNLTASGSSDVFVTKYLLSLSPVPIWAFKIGNNDAAETSNSIVLDPSGNLLVTGGFAGQVDFGSGTPLSSLGSSDVFVTTYTAATGQYQSAFAIGSAGSDYGNKLAFDTSGNLIVTGYVTGNPNFVPSPGTTFNNDGFLAKYCVGPFTVSPSTTITCGTGVTLTATGATNFNWSPATGLSSTTGPNVIANPTSTTTYTVTGTECSGSIASRNVTVTVTPFNATASPASICVGSSTTLKAEGGSNYSWSPATGLSSTTGATVTANPTVTTTYTVTAIDCQGNAVSKDVTVSVYTKPTTSAITGLAIVGINSNCVSYSVSNNAGNNYTWSITGGHQSNGNVLEPSGSSITVNWGAAGTGSVRVIESNPGCPGDPVTKSVEIRGSILPINGRTNVCANETITYNVVNHSGSNYEWYIDNGTQTGGGTTNSISIAWGSTGSGNISVRETNTTSGCLGDLVSVPVTVNAYPNPTLVSDDADNIICVGQSVKFMASVTATGGANYDFKVNGVSKQKTSQNTVYTTTTLQNGDQVTVSMNNPNNTYCVATSSPITMTVNQNPVAGLASSDSDNTICAGDNVTFTASGGTTYDFMVDGISKQSGTSNTYSTSALLNGQKVSVKVTNDNSCFAISSDITMTVKQRPTSIISGSNPVCLGSSTQISIALTGTAPWNLTYSDGTTSTPVSGITTNSYIINVAPTSTKTYTVTALSDANCTSQAGDRTGSAVITVNPKPTITPGSIPAVCAGTTSSTLPYSATTGTPNQYRIDWATLTDVPPTSLPASPIPITGLPATAGTYTGTLYVINSSGCESTGSPISVIVNSLPSVTADPKQVCSGSSVALTGTPSGGTWSGTSVSGSTFNSTGLATGDYSVTYTYTNSNICTNSATTLVTVNSLPIVTADPKQVCTGNSVSLTGTPSGGTWSGTGISGSTFSSTGLASGDYSVTYTYTNSNNCTNSATALVTINSLPTATITPSGSTHLCPNGSVILQAASGTNYQWYKNDDYNTIIATSSSITVSAINPGKYSVVVVNSNGCSNTAFATVTSTIAKINTTEPFCSGKSITLWSNTLAAVLNGSPITYTYKWQKYGSSWSTVATTINYTTSTNGKYRLVVTDSKGCTSTSSELTLTALSNPKPTISVSGDVCMNGYQTLTSTTASSYNWSTGSSNSSISGYEGGSYYVTATYSNGCSNTSNTYTVSTCTSDPCYQYSAINGRVPGEPCLEQAALSEAPITQAMAYPNPAKENLTIRIPNKAEVDTPVLMVNQFGQIVKSQILFKGTDRTEFNINDVTNGVYIVQVKNITLKVVIAN